MGVEELPKELHYGNIEDQRVGFLTLDIFLGQVQRPADIDIDTLAFVCTLRHEQAHGEGGYPPKALPTTRPIRQKSLGRRTGHTGRRTPLERVGAI